jgi:hypothetical protein
LTTADGMVAGVVALAPDNPSLLEEQEKVLILFARLDEAGAGAAFDGGGDVLIC